MSKEPVVLYDYVATDSRMLSINKGKTVTIINKAIHKDWCKIEYEGNTGYFPINFLHIPQASSVPQGFMEFF